MKKLLFTFPILIGTVLFSTNANANAWCKRPQIANHNGGCYFENLAIIQNNTTKKYGFANKQSHIVIPTEYDKADDFSQGLSAVQLGEYWGMIDKHHQVIIPFIYEHLDSPNQHGIIRANKNGQWGFIDKNQNELLVFGKYDYVEPFAFDGFAWVRQDDKWGFIDKQFNEIAPPQYDTHNYFTRPIVCIKKNGKSGCINKQGVEVVPFIYDKIDAFMVGKHQKQVVAYLNGEVFYFDKKGRALK